MSGRDEFATSSGLCFGGAPLLMGVERSGGACGRAFNGGSGAGCAAESGELEGRQGQGAPVGVNEEPPRKRARTARPEDAAALRCAVLDCHLLRLKMLRDRFTEQLSELYFLQAGGNMMDYGTWRRRPPAPQLAAFIDARRPALAPELPPAPAAPTPAPPPATPAPAAPAVPTAPAGAAAAVAAAAAAAVADEMVEKAKQEAYVARRVAELARAGLWTERRLPRVLEPPRGKSHWDYLLEEMAWLAQDFAHERKWKKQAARKCARAVQKYFQDKALAAQRAEKAQEMQLKKIAAFAAKEIRTFWSNVEKLVEWKRVRRVERARKQALDEQLSYIVDRTERYSRQLAANLSCALTAPTAPAAPGALSDDEFTPRGCSDDDEETIAADERDAPLDADAQRHELELLQRESHLDLGDLLPPGYLPAHSPPPSDYSPSDDDSADDERTIAAQERSERARDHAAELEALRRDADADLDELVRRYAGTDADPDPDAGTDTDIDADANTDTHTDTDTESGELTDEDEAPLETLMREPGAEPDGASSRHVEAASSLAATLQPTGTTLSETTVGTPVPRLLRHALREYQHVGLHWLATMHARGLNGILADEMGLGKTVQTIALLAHLALERRDWGPHLVVAPTSVVLNWEMEFKKWCPAFKILTYYGTIKERKQKRVGWTKANSFHVCITSYKLVVQDHQSFRRKKWKYLILDEAQNIKNFKSQRWQLLLNFQTERRLLLTGTPLQNSLAELWSLMHFLMPHVFASHSEFGEWFAEVGAMAEGARCADAALRRLHAVLRPFLLRRLKRDVERQMPNKYERVLMCRLAARQRCLYDDFMARAKTKESLASGNLLSVINVLMQLRKVCNHPDLFEPRPVTSPLQLPALRLGTPALALEPAAALLARADLATRLGGDLAGLELAAAEAFAAHRARHLAPPRRALEDLEPWCSAPPPRLPPTPLRLHLRLVPRAAPATAAPAPPATSLLASLPLPGAAARRACPPRGAPAAAASGTVAGAGRGRGQERLEVRRRAALRRLAVCNERRCWRLPLYGADLLGALSAGPPVLPPRRLSDLLSELHDIIDRFSICWAPARAPAAQLWAGAGEAAREWRRCSARTERVLAGTARSALALLHGPGSRQAVAFPHPSLLQYDCGKLQTLALLLRRLRAGGHRVLIFTQMTRVLDVLEAFLSMHGHAYLRLDGATRVDRRQPLVDRFNADPRIFAFILSTRSGGVGLNLTGADSVVFYDSDWNPTMDAQAQDRCHRIGQTRDVHVYRLVTAATVEENILRKAEQKRALGHLAIEDGHFTTSTLRGVTVHELFGTGTGTDTGNAPGAATDLETALAAAEDEVDAAAARAARAEAQGDLAEFDETVPLEDETEASHSAAATASTATSTSATTATTATATDTDAHELAALMNQLSPIEKYAMRIVETGEAASEAERVALADMRRQLHEWEEARRQLRQPDPDPDLDLEPDPDQHQLTYCRGDARAEVWLSGALDRMPMWCPPTPPSGDGDVYCEPWARALYRPGAAPDALLPAPHRREPRAGRDRRARPPPRAPPAPPSLFERGGPRPRPRVRPPPAHPHAGHAPPHQPDWTPAEDAALRRALRLQRAPSEPPPALATNWDWVADLVADVARAFRSPRACRDRHEALADPERARRRHRRPPAARRRADDDRPRPPLTRLEAVRDATERRRAAPKRRLEEPPPRNPKHAQLLADHGLDYDAPPTPQEAAARRADRITREKLKAATTPAPSAPAAAPAATPSPACPAGPQRVLVAAAKPDARRPRPAEPPRAPLTAPAAPAAAPAAAAQLLYRQQAFSTRHLKILHPTVAPPAQGMSGGGGSDGGAALRKLQLQQLALRRSVPATSGAGAGAGAAAVTNAGAPHVVVAHLTPAAHPPHGPPAQQTRPPDTRQ